MCRSAYLLAVIFLFCAGAAKAEEDKPLWEYGFSAVQLNRPAYPASDVTRTATIAVPYFIYRGAYLRVEGRQLRARAMLTERLELDLSVSGALNADSEDVPAREGMPDLSFLFELGPQLTYHAMGRRGQPGYALRFSAPIRQVFAVGGGAPRTVGQVFAPQLELEYTAPSTAALSFSLELELLFGNERMQNYFYTVAPRYETATRPHYAAKSGYMGAELDIGISYRLTRNLTIFFSPSIFYADGAANAASPLFKKKRTHSTAMAFIWRFGESKSRVRRRF